MCGSAALTKGYAVIFMTSEREAQAAIEALYGIEFKGTSLRVTPFRSREEIWARRLASLKDRG